jgi:hypothetical protein
VKPLHAHLAAKLYWTQPKALTRSYELHANSPGSEIVVARLCFEHPFGSLAEGQTTTGWWSFRRDGFFKPTVSVRVRGRDENVAVYHPRWTGIEGEITTARGVYTFRIANFWGNRHEIRDEEDQILAIFRSGCPDAKLSDFFKSQSTLTITAEGSADPLIDLLVVTGWYLIVLNRDDTAAIVATTAAIAPTSKYA